MPRARLTESHDRGTTDVPLVEETLGDFFQAMAARQPEREALVSVHQGRLHLRPAARCGRPAGQRAAAAGTGHRRPHRHLSVTGKIQKFRIRETMRQALGLAESRTA